MKSRGVYIILGLLLGGIGAHNFYIGRYSEGAINVMLSVIVWVLAFVNTWLAVAVALIFLGSIILELVVRKTDANGNPLQM